MSRQIDLFVGALLVGIGLLFCYWAFVNGTNAPDPSSVTGIGNVIGGIGGYATVGPLSVLLGVWRLLTSWVIRTDPKKKSKNSGKKSRSRKGKKRKR